MSELRAQTLTALHKAADKAVAVEGKDAEDVAVGLAVLAYQPDLMGPDARVRAILSCAVTIIRQAREIEALRAALAESREVEW